MINSCLNVIGFFALTRIGSLVALSKPVRTFGSANSGKVLETGSSSVMRPRWTHCKAEIEVRSFVHDAIQNTASCLISSALSSSDSFPNAFSYLYKGSVRKDERLWGGMLAGRGTSGTCFEDGV